MTDCQNCEYHKNRAARWRAEAYAQAGHDIIERTWVGLTDEEIKSIWLSGKDYGDDWLDVQSIAKAIEAKLKEKNNG